MPRHSFSLAMRAHSVRPSEKTPPPWRHPSACPREGFLRIAWPFRKGVGYARPHKKASVPRAIATETRGLPGRPPRPGDAWDFLPHKVGPQLLHPSNKIPARHYPSHLLCQANGPQARPPKSSAPARYLTRRIGTLQLGNASSRAHKEAGDLPV